MGRLQQLPAQTFLCPLGSSTTHRKRGYRNYQHEVAGCPGGEIGDPLPRRYRFFLVAVCSHLLFVKFSSETETREVICCQKS